MFDPVKITARDTRSWSYGIEGTAISAKDFTTTVVRVINADVGDLEMSADDADWGEQDDGSGLRPRTVPGWVRALQMQSEDD